MRSRKRVASQGQDIGDDAKVPFRGARNERTGVLGTGIRVLGLRGH